MYKYDQNQLKRAFPVGGLIQEGNLVPIIFPSLDFDEPSSPICLVASFYEARSSAFIFSIKDASLLLGLLFSISHFA